MRGQIYFCSDCLGRAHFEVSVLPISKVPHCHTQDILPNSGHDIQNYFQKDFTTSQNKDESLSLKDTAGKSLGLECNINAMVWMELGSLFCQSVHFLHCLHIRLSTITSTSKEKQQRKIDLYISTTCF